MSLPSKWFHGVAKNDKDARERFVRSHSEVLELLTDILQREHDDLLRKAQARELYDHAAWPYEQADLNGHMRALRSILEIIDLTKDRND